MDFESIDSLDTNELNELYNNELEFNEDDRLGVTCKWELDRPDGNTGYTIYSTVTSLGNYVAYLQGVTKRALSEEAKYSGIASSYWCTFDARTGQYTARYRAITYARDNSFFWNDRCLCDYYYAVELPNGNYHNACGYFGCWSAFNASWGCSWAYGKVDGRWSFTFTMGYGSHSESSHAYLLYCR